ncbi:S1C family serine protease [Actinomadura parmotrematis]|uniref:S1C family serine protease n=1 Tax=Actinomadura parmotrematis TaxID=2864039 RepID=UPI0027E3AA12|nr:trypsin-like peptidase domain-containing protein [Actinomadura parmotrematis]
MDNRIGIGVRAGAVVLAGALALAACGEDSRTAARTGASASATASSGAAGGAAAGAPVAQTEAQYEKVVNEVLPSVVQIKTDEGEGSGVVYDDQGDIVTNAHVVAGAKQITVTAASGGQALDAELVGSFNADDLAVVKVSGANLKAARFADSGNAKVGQMVLAMGNPLGLAGSVTNGIVSALNRTVSTQREGAFPGATIGNAIQTSAAINPGNSGGALVDMSGQVLGIPTAAASDPQMGGAAVGIGFATPSNTVKSIVPQLIKDGKVSNTGRAALGVTVRTIIDQSGEETSVGVVSVTRGGPADAAGIKAGDMIVSVNGTRTPSQTELAEVLAQLSPGDTAKVEIKDTGGATRTVDVKLGELPGS